MVQIQLEDKKQYGEVLYQLCYKIGGAFHGRPDYVLIISDWQLKALQDAGVIGVEVQGTATNGKNKKKK